MQSREYPLVFTQVAAGEALKWQATSLQFMYLGHSQRELNNFSVFFCLLGGLRPPDTPPWIPGSIYYPYSRYYMDHTIDILPISQTLYGPYGPYRSTYQRVWTARSIYSSVEQNIWTVRSIFSSTYQKTLIVRSIYGSTTFPKMVEQLKIPNSVDES